MTAVDPTVMAGQYARRAPYNNILGEFRGLVLQRLGKFALAILDAKLSHEELRGLVGRSELGSPSAYQIKREVGEVKERRTKCHDTTVSSDCPAKLRDVLERTVSCMIDQEP
jgi:hypothetical protein